MLWTPWIHQGRLRAKHECDILKVDSGHFLEVVLEFPSYMKLIRSYGQRFLEELKQLVQELGMLSDLQYDVTQRQGSKVKRFDG